MKYLFESREYEKQTRAGRMNMKNSWHTLSTIFLRIVKMKVGWSKYLRGNGTIFFYPDPLFDELVSFSSIHTHSWVERERAKWMCQYTALFINIDTLLISYKMQ